MSIQILENIKDLDAILDFGFDFYYIKDLNISFKRYSDTIRITDLTNALCSGKMVQAYTIYSDISAFYNFLQDGKMDLYSYVEGLRNGSLQTYAREEKGIRTYSPFANVKNLSIPKKWTLSHIWKAILSGQIAVGFKEMRLTDDYAYDASSNFGKGSLSLSSFAKDLIESPSGWWLSVQNEDDKEIVLSVNCHQFDYNRLVFSK